MAFRRSLTGRLYNVAKTPSSKSAVLHKKPVAPANNAAAKSSSQASESSGSGFVRRFFHRRAAGTQMPDFLPLPVGDMLREKLTGMNVFPSAGERLSLERVFQPAAPEKTIGGMSVEDTRKLMRISQVEKLKHELKRIEKNTITYGEFLRICVDRCENNAEQGMKFAKLMDESGNVIVLGNTVFLRPEQVAKTMETIISQTIAEPNNPRKKELEEMEKEKAIIDHKAAILVQRELYCGLGFMVLQTLGAMRLTFWELSWDVMEPICFFVTSLNFAAGYTFFLRTSTEPSFEGYWQRRFKTKQKKIMQMQGFDEEKYNELKMAFYPSSNQRANVECDRVPLPSVA